MMFFLLLFFGCQGLESSHQVIIRAFSYSSYRVWYNLVSVFLLDLVVGLIEKHMTEDQVLSGESFSEVTRVCDNISNEIQVENKSLQTDCNIGREWSDTVSSGKDLEI